MFAKDRQLLLVAAAIVLVVAGLALYREVRPGYAQYQEQFKTIVDERFGPERGSAVPTGLQQIWLSSADRVDRCTSCHLGVSWQGLSDVDQPYRSHPPEPLVHHPVERFGCTYCHGGQGPATELPDAHGWVAHWEEPLFDTRLARDYGIRDQWAFVEIRCNVCHRYDRRVEGAEHINEGKQLIQAKGCRACHVINGRGGSIGPDLTWLGEKNPEQYDYSRLTGLKSLFSWQVGHLQNPKSFSPDTVMPDFGFQTSEAQSITMVLMSWKFPDVPVELLPGAILEDVPTPEEAERERIMLEGEGKFFVEKTCFVCHDVSSLGITSATKIGPDLAQAVEDAPRRFGRTLEHFLMNPTGTMQVVLSKQIQLTDDEKREALRLLHIAYDKYQEQQKGQEESRPK